MEVEIEVDPSPIIPEKSSNKKKEPLISESDGAGSSSAENTPPRLPEKKRTPIRPRLIVPEAMTPTELLLHKRLEKEERAREAQLRQINESIDIALYSQYFVLNTKVFIAAFFILIFVAIGVAVSVSSKLPKALKETDLGSGDTKKVIGVRAMENLIELSNFGPKPVGSYENEYLVVDYLKNELERIKEEAPVRWNGIDIDIQVVSGNFSAVKRDKTFRKQTTYKNVQNVVAKLYSKDNVTESILVNCHFDSVFTSPGTSDDGLNCAVMLEVLRVMSKVDHSLKRNVIFLFNGAEEDGVSGSHGFITEHKWFNEIICFINLDACGAGGRQMLFQTSQNAYVLPKIYSNSVPYPNGKVFEEEIFQNGGFVPSDTDFRNFHDHGKLNGLDFAHVHNGYVYHTSSDNISMVSEDVVQLTGDNVLALLHSLVDYDHLKEELENGHDQAVYYDIFGEFVICYSSTVGFLINTAVVFLSLYSAMSLLYSIFKAKPTRIILEHVLIDLIFVVIGIVAVSMVLYLLAGILRANNATMLWYSNQWFVLSYYATAVLLVMFTVLKIRHEFVHTMLNREQEAKVFIFVIQFIMTVMLSMGTLRGIRSSFILAIGLIGVSISHYFLNKTKVRFELGKIHVYLSSIKRKFITYTAINFVPALYSAYVFIPFFQMMIPMLGRMGADYDAEKSIWISTEIAVFITFAYLIPLVLLVKEFWTMQYVFSTLFLIEIVVVISQAFVPFSDNAPQKFYALHVDRKLAFPEYAFKNESSGYLVVPRNTRGKDTIFKLFDDYNFQQLGDTDDCTKTLFCGMPTLHAASLSKQYLSYWTRREVSKTPRHKQMKYNVEDHGYGIKTFHVTLNGSKFMDAIILPLNGAKLVQWNFNPSTPGNELQWNGQPAYFIRYHEGSLNQSTLSFQLKFDVHKMHKINSHVFKLAWSVFYPSNNTEHFTPQFKTFIGSFPSWSRVVPMVAEYEEYLLSESNT